MGNRILVFSKYQALHLVASLAHATLACQRNSACLEWKQQLQVVPLRASLL